jgi:hypothetical protein
MKGVGLVITGSVFWILKAVGCCFLNECRFLLSTAFTGWVTRLWRWYIKRVMVFMSEVRAYWNSWMLWLLQRDSSSRGRRESV